MHTLIRADLLLVETGLAHSRTHAQSLIEAGRVSYLQGNRHCPINKPSQKLLADSQLQVAGDAEADRYVSRGGHKLAGALAQSGLDPRGWHCLDVGISTGGFTDCLLQAGAAQIVGLDVGHDQLHPRLRDEPRLQQLEGINARSLDPTQILALNEGQPFDLLVADVSFISLTLVLPAVRPLLKDGGQLLCLVKPQFEVGREGIGRGGLVRDAARYPQVREKLQQCCISLGLQPKQWFDSPILGGDGNREFFIHAEATA